MTMIAIACKGDRAEFVTDSLHYSRSFRQIGTTTKSMVLHHIDGAILTQGSGDFGIEIRCQVDALSRNANTFDELLRVLPDILADAWELTAPEGGWPPHTASRAFLVGWSDTEGEYVSYGLYLEHGFQARRLPPMFITPTPWAYRPNEFELDGTDDGADSDAEWLAWRDQTIAAWKQRPEPPLPADLDAWLTLVAGARGRAITSFRHWPVGGKVFHTTMDRGTSVTGCIVEFDQTLEDLLMVIGWTLHPLGQVRRCGCGSGLPAIDCHLGEEREEPCRCGSGETLANCCLLSEAEIDHWKQAIEAVDQDKVEARLAAMMTKA